MVQLRKWRKRVLLAIAGAVAVLLTVLALKPSSVLVDVARIKTGSLMVTVDEEGEARVRDRFVLAAPVSGRLARIDLKEGDSVRQGSVVARIDPLPLDARATEQATARLDASEDAERVARATLAAARAALQQAGRDRVRADSMAAASLISPEQHELAVLAETSRAREVEAADFRAQSAAHEVTLARAALRPSRGRVTIDLRAPVSARVLRLVEQSERVIPAGAPLLELGDPSRLEIVVDLLSSEAVKVAPGDTMLVEEWGGGRTLRARLRRVEPSGFTKVSALGVEEQRVNVVGDFIDPPGPLGDRYRVETRTIIWQADSVLLAPSSSLFRCGGDWCVFLVRAGRARQQPVKVGHRGAFEVEITDGLTAGDLAIRHPSDRIADGVRVQARGAAAD